MMTVQITESVWLNSTDICSFEHIIEVSGLHDDELRVLIETGVVSPSNADPHNYFFHTECIVLARRARRLRDDFDIDIHGVSLALRLLDRIDELESQLSSVRARTRGGKLR